jgi:hypothetical protein
MESIPLEQQQEQLRNMPGKIRKALIAAIAGYNTVHRPFTTQEDRGNDIVKALVELSQFHPKALGNVGLTAVLTSTSNYVGDFLKDKTERMKSATRSMSYFRGAKKSRKRRRA